MALVTYTPEMDEERPAIEMEARSAYAGGYYVWTLKNLKGVGIKLLDNCDTGVVSSSTRHCKRKYKLTEKAFEKLTNSNDVSMEATLS